MAQQPPIMNGSRSQTPRQQAADERSYAPPMLSSNGTAGQIEDVLMADLSAGYKPKLPIYTFREDTFNYYDFYYDIEAMLMHDCITAPLRNVMAPVGQMQISVTASSKRVADFVVSEWEHFKQNWLPKVQESGYPYGWMGAEPVYGVKKGLQVQTGFHDFAPRDVQPLIRNSQVVGIKVAGVEWNDGCLPGSSKGFPAKGFWYAHRPRYGQHYGQSQIRSAWKPWRCLTGRDGVEEIMAIASYRYGTGSVIVYAPLEDVKATNQASNSASGGRISAIQQAREIGENMKAGGSVVCPTTFYPNGHPKWDIKFEQPQTNLPELMEVEKSLYTKCAKAIGISPEIMEAAETGSGYSGRQIPLEAFLMSEQITAQGLFMAWFNQIGMPLVWWNFGQNAWCEPKVIPLLETYRKAGQPQPPPQPAPQASPAPATSGPAQAGTSPPNPAARGTPGKIPYHGPRGGKGWRDAQGRVHYGALMSTILNGSDADIVYLTEAIDDLSHEELDQLTKMMDEYA